MSYEGYSQLLCASGHYWTLDAFNPEIMGGVPPNEQTPPPKCPACKEPAVWENGVDVTNGSYDTDPETGKEIRIDGFIELEIDAPAKTCKCQCGNVHAVTGPTYKIPKKHEEAS